MGEVKMSDMTTIRSIEQERARFAYDHVKSVSKEKYNDKYKSYVKKIPMLIKTNGLGPTFAFIMSKKREEKENGPYHSIYEQTTDWLLKDNNPFNINVNNDLVKNIISLDSKTYRLMTNEVLFLFKWIIRFADGLIEEGSENDGTGNN
jgi:CRISPR-associated protein Cmr5